MKRCLPLSILGFLPVLLALPTSAFAQSPAPPAEPPPAPPAAPAPPAPPAPPPSSGSVPVELTTLRLLRDKSLITPAEYDSAVRDLSESVGMHAGDQATVVMGKWATTLYGFTEADTIWDSTQSFNDLAGGALVARPGTVQANNSRVTFGARNSRIGLRMKALELPGGIRTSAQLEMDFLGNQQPVGVAQPYQISEGAYFTSPAFRVRHMNFKVETPVVDVLAGQYWQLFGWQNIYNPNSVEIQGLPGELYARTPQVRVSKTLKLDPITIEIAVGAFRPVQRDSGVPDGQAGLRFALDSWTGVQTIGATGTQISPLSIAVTGLVRQVNVYQWSAKPTATNQLSTNAIALDGFLPVIPGTKEKKANSLSLNGEFVTGSGFADMYTGFTGGMGFPAIPPPAGSPAGTAGTAFAADIDNGIVTYDTKGNLHAIDWQSYLVGLQYYFPACDGRFWISGNYSHISSDNTSQYATTKTAALSAVDWFDANLFVDATPAVRIGAEYANFKDTYLDGTTATNHRVQLSGFYIF